jgi:integrase
LVGVLELGQDGHGRRKRKWITGKTKVAVLEKLTKMRAQLLTGELSDTSRLTVGVYLWRWLEDAVRPAVAPSTYTLYEGIIRLHLDPHLGHVLVTRLGPAHIQSTLATMEQQEDASPRLRQMTFAVLRAALGQALRWGMVSRNVCTAVVRPRAPRHPMKVFTPAQVLVLFAAAKSDRLGALYVVAATTGLRQGELFGLQWDDIDLPHAAVQVRHQLRELSGKVWLAPPKTGKGRRKVDLTAVAVTALREHRMRMLAEGHPHGFVFCDTDGQPLRKSNVLRRSFLPLLARAGLPRIRFHDLRHTAATLLLQQGVHPKVVQEMLGHAQISLTLDTYSRVLPSLGEDAARRLDALLQTASADAATP